MWFDPHPRAFFSGSHESIFRILGIYEASKDSIRAHVNSRREGQRRNPANHSISESPLRIFATMIHIPDEWILEGIAWRMGITVGSRGVWKCRIQNQYSLVLQPPSLDSFMPLRS